MLQGIVKTHFVCIAVLMTLVISCKSTSVNRRGSAGSLIEENDSLSSSLGRFKSCTQPDSDKQVMCMEVLDSSIEYCLGEMSEAPCDAKLYARKCTQESFTETGPKTFVYYFKADSKVYCAGQEIAIGQATKQPVPPAPPAQSANPPIPLSMANKYCTVTLLRDVKDGGSIFKAMKDQTYFAAASSQALALVPQQHSYIDVLLPDGTFTSNCSPAQLRGFMSESVVLQDFNLCTDKSLTQMLCTVKQGTVLDDLSFSALDSDATIFSFSSASTTVPENCRGKELFAKDSFIERLTRIAPPDTATTPASPPAKLPIRTVANAAEISNARAAYESVCARCHGTLANSTKKGVVLVRLNAASTIAAHTSVNAAGNWPIDVNDSIDDGIDTAVLKASAMVEALK